jgi:hypothetical protein
LDVKLAVTHNLAVMREGKNVKYVFANTTAQRENKLNHHANTPAAVKMNEINPKYEKYAGY